MQRYFITEGQLNNGQVIVNGDDANHISRVMRMKLGDQIICTINNEKSALCELIEITNDTVLANVVEWLIEQTELPVKITIAQGLPKGDKLDTIIQKGTELGSYRFIPFKAERSIVKWDEKKAAKKIERLSKVAKEAAEQSHRTTIPICTHLHSFKELLHESESFDYKIFAYEEAAKKNETSNLIKTFNEIKKDESLMVVIGPEGGISENEADLLTDYGFIPCGLGPRILRTETASQYILSAASYHFELF